MKNYNITKIFFVLSLLLLTIASCQTNDIEELSKTKVKDFTEAELVKLTGEIEKKWKLTDVIYPEKYIGEPALMNNACVADDIYTFSTPTTYNSLRQVKIELGQTRCFESVSDSERFEAQLLYVPYKLNGVEVIETTLILKNCRIENTVDGNGTNGTFTRCSSDAFRLVELTEDRAVFSNATYVGEYTFGYVFERIQE
jgi:hypothetical protein